MEKVGTGGSGPSGMADFMKELAFEGPAGCIGEMDVLLV